jgi:glycosyltransferase involved in cell wall biosynthesis
VLVCNEYPPRPHGGIGSFVRTLAEGLVGAGHEATVVGWGRDAGQREERGVRVVTLPESRLRGVAWLLNRVRLHRWLEAEARAGRIDLVEVPEFQGLLPFRFSACPVVVRLHLAALAIDQQAGKRTPVLVRWCERRTLASHGNWIAVSRYVLDLTRKTFGLEPVRGEVVYNAVSVPPGEPSEASCPPYLLYAGAISERKGALVLAEACREILVEHPDLELVYAGGISEDGPVRLDSRISALLGRPLSSRVRFLGRLPHGRVLALMRGARICVFPSRLEAFSLVPLEAMACGSPVVYTTACSGPEAIDHDETGLLADPTSASDVARQIRRLLGDPGLRARLAERARQVVSERFSLERCLVRTLECYEIASRGGAK